MLRHKLRTFSEKKVTEHKICFDSVHRFVSETLLILTAAQLRINTNVHKPPGIAPVVFVRLQRKSIFSRQVSEKSTNI